MGIQLQKKYSCCEIAGIVISFFPFSLFAQNISKNYYLKIKDENINITTALIDSSVTVLTKRLDKQHYKNTAVYYDEAKHIFVISTGDFIDTNYIKLRLIKPFRVVIYETYNLEEIASSLSYLQGEKAMRDTILRFYELLNLRPGNFESFKRSSYIGVLPLKDTAAFNRVCKSLAHYLPPDLFFAFPFKLSSPGVPEIEIYALKKSKYLFDVNKLLYSARDGRDNMGHPSIKFEFNEKGKRLFSELTYKNLYRPIAFTFDNRVCTAPNVVGRIEGGVLEITGSFTEQEASELASLLAGGYLPLSLAFAGE